MRQPTSADPTITRLLLGRQRSGGHPEVASAAAPAVPIALARMNSDSVTPLDLADWASTSRSFGRRGAAARAWRFQDSDHRRRGPSLWSFSSCLITAFPP